MTSGIYLLTFEDLPYIGQSQNIEQRYLKHLQNLKSGTHVVKLQQAYRKYGVPDLTILEECDNLDDREIFYINFFDSINNGLNTCEGASPPVLKGIDHGRSKYTKDQILEVFRLLSDPIYPYRTIAKLTGVQYSTVKNISSGQNHLWVKDEYPDIYEVFLKNRKYRLE